MRRDFTRRAFCSQCLAGSSVLLAADTAGATPDDDRVPQYQTGQGTGNNIRRAARDDRHIYLQTLDGTVHALNVPELSERWTSEVPDGQSLSVADDIVVAGGDEGLDGFDAETGEREWTADIDPVYPPLRITGETVYAIVDRSRIEAVELDTGDERWTFLPDGVIGEYISMAVAGERAYAAPVGGETYAVDLTNGETAWSVPVAGSVTATPDAAYVADGDVHAVDARTGDWRWSVETEAYVGDWITIEAGTVYAGGEYLYAIDAETGTLRWAFDTPERVRLPTADGDSVYTPCRDGNVYAVDRSDGSHEWTFEAGGITVPEPVTSGNRVYVGSTRRLYALDAMGEDSDRREARDGIGRTTDDIEWSVEERFGESTTSRGFGPGFGVISGLAGVTAAGLVARRGADNE